ncbi:SURF1 family protein [Herbaspirillum rubrisubalbicans]|uniref:SURF1-like protein n=1 Tax=Herbaspirillum rubrisubalbicans TaxID=80842 RepID=A0AAD0U8Y3_9BURK|nr:SURF1 family protein [Herbaspirillum rubrisubalbicans]ALU89375.1 surfeit 1 protein [Herbaspirillum rubrisubalbicans M1]AYR24436.1 SURF1 family protein [Herbaspirillum rubrisubalbicans]
MSPTPPHGVTQGKESGTASAVPVSRTKASLLLLTLLAGFFFLVFAALGTWQVYRLQWKLDLIAKVDARVHAAPTAPPGPQDWPQVSAERDEYKRVDLRGRYLYSKTVAVQASTDLGSGSWLLTPLQMADGVVVLVNRGFVSTSPIKLAELHLPDAPADQATEVTGLLRMSEQGGGFLRSNDAAQNRWYSRDVKAIAQARGLEPGKVAPYFIDADQASAQADAAVAPDAQKPVGGLTVIAFHNSHLVYALTWYALALMSLGAGYWVIRDERRWRQRIQDAQAKG